MTGGHHSTGTGTGTGRAILSERADWAKASSDAPVMQLAHPELWYRQT